jgi:preprotein translocase subunit SecA
MKLGKEHLRKMDELKQSVQLAVLNKRSLLIYKFEAFNLSTMNGVNKEVISFLFKGDLPQQVLRKFKKLEKKFVQKKIYN